MDEEQPTTREHLGDADSHLGLPGSGRHPENAPTAFHRRLNRFDLVGDGDIHRWVVPQPFQVGIGVGLARENTVLHHTNREALLLRSLVGEQGEPRGKLLRHRVE